MIGVYSPWVRVRAINWLSCLVLKFALRRRCSERFLPTKKPIQRSLSLFTAWVGLIFSYHYAGYGPHLRLRNLQSQHWAYDLKQNHSLNSLFKFLLRFFFPVTGQFIKICINTVFRNHWTRNSVMSSLIVHVLMTPRNERPDPSSTQLYSVGGAFSPSEPKINWLFALQDNIHWIDNFKLQSAARPIESASVQPMKLMLADGRMSLQRVKKKWNCVRDVTSSVLSKSEDLVRTSLWINSEELKRQSSQ